LKSAIDLLAQARQTSAQSAQAEIRTKLHGGSIVAHALAQSTGRMIEITSNSWATEPALQWLESGTCLLPDENGKVRITDERLGLLYQAEAATIFILENDLRRLMVAKPKGAGARELGRMVISNVEAKTRFDEWRKSRGDDIPSQKEDVNHMRQFGVSRDRVKDLRRGGGIINLPRGKPHRDGPK
jgi:hypothetical protein